MNDYNSCFNEIFLVISIWLTIRVESSSLNHEYRIFVVKDFIYIRWSMKKMIKIEIYEEIAEIGLSFRDLRFFLKKRKKNICTILYSYFKFHFLT